MKRSQPLSSRCSPQELLLWKSVLKTCSKFSDCSWKFNKIHRKTPVPESLCCPAGKFIKKGTLAQVFSCEFCEIFKNTFFTEHLWTTASDALELYWNSISARVFSCKFASYFQSTYLGQLLKLLLLSVSRKKD